MRGGKREGFRRPVGRPKGSLDKAPRKKKNQEIGAPTRQGVEAFKEFNKKFYFRIRPYLSEDTRKLYESVKTEYKSPLECLKIVLDDLMVRYKIGRIEELKAKKAWRGLAEEVNAIRQLAELVDRIEHDRPKYQLNILSLLNDPKREKEAEALRKKIFSDPSEDNEASERNLSSDDSGERQDSKLDEE